MTSKTVISDDDTAGALHDRLALMGAELIVPTLAGLEAGTLRGTPQDESKVTYASKLEKSMEWLDPKETARTLELRVRALNPWPGTSVWVNEDGKIIRLKVKRAKARADLNGPQGKIFERAGMVLLGTSLGSLELLSLQWDGKKEIEPGAFINGLRGRGRAFPLETCAPA